MMKNMLFAAMCVFCVSIVIFIAVLGGCGNSRRAAALFGRGVGLVKGVGGKGVSARIGDDASSIGCLEEKAVVTATVFRAEGGREDGVLVDLSPGVWLVPSRVFERPGEMEEGASGDSGSGR